MTLTGNYNSAATDVLIGGRVYSLRGADPEHLQRVAAFLNQKIPEVRSLPGYKTMDQEYRQLLLNLNLADEYFLVHDEAERLRSEIETKDAELYAVRHDLVSLKLKLENALKQQNVLERRAEEWKNRYEEFRAGLAEMSDGMKAPGTAEKTGE